MAWLSSAAAGHPGGSGRADRAIGLGLHLHAGSVIARQGTLKQRRQNEVQKLTVHAAFCLQLNSVLFALDISVEGVLDLRRQERLRLKTQDHTHDGA
jgi:hypothetical protein